MSDLIKELKVIAEHLLVSTDSETNLEMYNLAWKNQDSISILEVQFEKLKEELKCERECVDFYANKDNWTDVDSYEYRGSMINSDDEEVTKTMEDSVFIYLKGGKRAREIQAKRK